MVGGAALGISGDDPLRDRRQRVSEAQVTFLWNRSLLGNGITPGSGGQDHAIVLGDVRLQCDTVIGSFQAEIVLHALFDGLWRKQSVADRLRLPI